SVDRPGASDDDLEDFARGLRDLVRSVPPRPAGSSQSAFGPSADAVAGIAAPALDDHSSNKTPTKSGEDTREGEQASSSWVRIGTPVGSPEAVVSARSDHAGSNRREVIAIPSVSPVRRSVDAEQASVSPRDPIGGPDTAPGFISDRAPGIDVSAREV